MDLSTPRERERERSEGTEGMETERTEEFGLGPVHAERERERLEGTEGTASMATVYGAR